MPENPLLPNAQLRKLYALMQRCRELARRDRSPNKARVEAILSATMLQLEPGDFVSPLSGSETSHTLADEHAAATYPDANRLALAAGAALALKQADGGRLALAFLTTGAAVARNEPGWAETLTYATRAELPLLLVCIDTASASTSPAALTWPSLSKLAKRLRLPVLTVDGSDAVAVYRVMQESTLRARTGGGTAILWCVLPPGADALRNMRNYLSARNLLPKASAAKHLR